jgi:hypothetical protein
LRTLKRGGIAANIARLPELLSRRQTWGVMGRLSVTTLFTLALQPRLANLGQFAATKFRRFLLIVYCRPPKLIRELRASCEPRRVSIGSGKINKFLVGPHKHKTHNRRLIVRLIIQYWRGMRRADAQLITPGGARRIAANIAKLPVSIDRTAKSKSNAGA